MSEKEDNLKWSEYDFTKTPYDKLVRVGQRNILYRDMFTVSWLLGRFATITVATVGLMLEAVEKTIDQLN